jgi:hypothetical protein
MDTNRALWNIQAKARMEGPAISKCEMAGRSFVSQPALNPGAGRSGS